MKSVHTWLALAALLSCGCNLVTKPDEFVVSQAVGAWAGTVIDVCSTTGVAVAKRTRAEKLTATMTLVKDGTGTGAFIKATHESMGVNAKDCPVDLGMPPALYSTSTWSSDGTSATITFADPQIPVLKACTNPTPDTLQCPLIIPGTETLISATLNRQ